MQRLRRYAANPDRRSAAVNSVALLIAANQPFYPLYVYWFVTENAAPSLLTLLSTPFFLAVPAVTRRFRRGGAALLCLAGTANTLLCAKLFGPASGVELFLIPCGLIAALAFRASERSLALALVGAIAALFFAARLIFGEAVHDYSAEELARFVSLHAYSVFGLTVLIGLSFAGATDDA